MTAVALPRTGLKFVLTIRDGPEDLGAVFQLLPPRVTIGRGGDNNIALKDSRVSRHAAVIEFTIEKITITDVSGRAAMMINGVSVPEALLNDGDLIFFGETELRFNVEALPLQPLMQPAKSRNPQTSVNAFNPAGGFPPPGPLGGGGYSPNSRLDEERNKKIRFYIIVAAALGVFLYFMTQEETKSAKQTKIRTVQQIEDEIKKSEDAREKIEKRSFKNEEERTRANESKRHFMEGFRDYQKGQWARAIRSFETAQAIDPKNESAGRYRRLAEKQRDEMVDTLQLEGRRYFEKGMFSRCSATFEKALLAMPNKQDLKYKSLEALKATCDAEMKERFR